jgi:hypothetical protein
MQFSLPTISLRLAKDGIAGERGGHELLLLSLRVDPSGRCTASASASNEEEAGFIFVYHTVPILALL